MYQKNPQKYTDLIKEKLLDLLEQAFPNPMLVNDLAKYVYEIHLIIIKEIDFVFLSNQDMLNVMVKQYFNILLN